MKKFVIASFAAAALCMPGAALADHYSIDPALFMEEFDSEEDCEDALAEERNEERKSGGYIGRERGEYNKTFNARYDCEETDAGTFMIVDNDAA